MDLNTIKNTGNWGNSASRLNENFSKVGTEVDKLKYAAYNSKLYASEVLLKQAIPSPSVGDWAIVGNAIPGEIYRCDTDGEWTATGQTGGGYGMEVTEKHVTEQYVTEVHNEYTGDIVNNPDDEDLISEEKPEGSKVLKLADKMYNASAFSGMGRVYLRKNISGSKNLLTQAMVDGMANTRFIVQYDYDLNGEAITIPEGCILDFQGGCIRNGSLIGSTTTIISPECLIFTDIIIEGSWNVQKVYSKWFNLSQIEGADNIANFRNMMKLATSDIMTDIYIENGIFYTSNYSTDEDGNYLNSKGISIPSNVYIHNAATIKSIANSYDKTAIFHLEDVENITIDGGKIIGDVKTHTGTSGEWGHGIYPIGARNLTIKNIEICEFWGDGIDIQASYSDYENGTTTGHCQNVLLDNVRCLNNRRQGISVEGVIGLTIRNSEFSGTGSYKYTAPGAGIDIEPWFDTEVVRDITIENCKLFNNKASGMILKPRNNDLTKNFTFNNIISDKGLLIQGGKDISISNFQATGKSSYCCIWGNVDGLSISNSHFKNELYFNGSVKKTFINRCSFDMEEGSWSGFAISFEGGEGKSYQDIVISDCSFKDTFKLRGLYIGVSQCKIDFFNNKIETNSSFPLPLGMGNFIGNTVVLNNSSEIQLKNLTGNTVEIANNVFQPSKYVDYILKFLDKSTVVNESINYDYIIANNSFLGNYFDKAFSVVDNNIVVKLSYNKFSKDIKSYIPNNWTYIEGLNNNWYTTYFESDSKVNVLTINSYCFTIPFKRGLVKIVTSNKYVTNSFLFNTETEFSLNPDSEDNYIKRFPTIVKEPFDLDNNIIYLLPQFATEIVGDNLNIYIKQAVEGPSNFVPALYLRTQAEITQNSINGKQVAIPDLDFDIKVRGDITSNTLSIPQFITPYNGMIITYRGNIISYRDGVWINPDGTLVSKVAIVYPETFSSVQKNFDKPNVTYKMTKDIDLGNETLNIPLGCTLDFQGGKIINGTIVLADTRILPFGCNVSEYISANIQGSYKEGQVLYDPALKKQKLWNGSFWTTLDGVILD